MTDIFVREFGRINEYFGETFQEMFGGGKGQLILEDPAEPLSCGIEIKVQPPASRSRPLRCSPAARRPLWPSPSISPS